MLVLNGVKNEVALEGGWEVEVQEARLTMIILESCIHAMPDQSYLDFLRYLF